MGCVLSSQASARLPRVHFSSPQVYVSVRKSGDPESTERTSLRALLESKCPSLFSEFRPAWWLFKYVLTFRENSILCWPSPFSGHLQTMYCVTGDFSKTDPVVYDRQATSHQTDFIVVLHSYSGSTSAWQMEAPCRPSSSFKPYCSPDVLQRTRLHRQSNCCRTNALDRRFTRSYWW